MRRIFSGSLMDLRLTQASKHPSPIQVTPAGISRLFRLMQLRNTAFSIMVRSGGSWISDRLVQPSKALCRRILILSGTLTAVRDAQSRMTLSPSSSSSSGKVMLLSFLQPSKA